MDSFIDIVLAPDQNYAKHACVALASILHNANENSKFRFWILNDGSISEDTKEQFLNITSKLSYQITFIHVSKEDFKDFPSSGYISINMWYRLKVESLLPDFIERVLYLDCDTIVESPLDYLFELDFGNMLIAGSLDCIWKKFAKRKNFDKDYNYFNSGVLLINLKLWREENTQQMIFDFIAEDTTRLKHLDQTVLNWCFEKRTLLLPPEWNFQYTPILLEESCYYDIKEAYKKAYENPKIIHFVGIYKPWKSGFLEFNKFSGNYYKYLKFTPFKFANQQEEINFLKESKTKKNSLFLKLFAKKIYKKPLYLTKPYFWKPLFLAFFWRF